MAKLNIHDDWLPLDNAAKIYPSSASVKSPAEFRIFAAMTEPVRLLHLQRALERVMPRFPYFQVSLRRGFFWYYLQRHNRIPEIELMENVPVGIISIRDRTAAMIRVSARGSYIAVDFSHILTDGNGGLRFFLTLLAEYVRTSGTSVGSHPNLIDLDQAPAPEEFEDAHRTRFFAGKTPAPEKMPPAYHIPGRPFLSRRYRLIDGGAPVDKVLRAAKRHGVTLTEYLAAVYMQAIIRIYQEESRPRRKPRRSVIRMEIPVDMRRYYPSPTMRNFSLFISPEIDMKLGRYTFEEILTEIHHRIQILKSRKQLQRQISRNVGAELKPYIRFAPLFLKDMVISSVYTKLGEQLHSGVISNLGRVDIPAEMGPFIRSLHFVLNPNHIMKKCCAVLSFRDELFISFGSVIEDRRLERYFFQHLVEDDIPVTVKEL